MVQLTFNYVSIAPIAQIEKSDKKAGERKNSCCPQIIKAYSKSMRGVDLAVILIALYRISVKVKRWYVKVLWHIVDIAKVNGWILYKRHRQQLGVPQKEEKTFLDFSCELAETLVKANKNVTNISSGRPSKLKSNVVKKGGIKQLFLCLVMMYVTIE